MWNRCCFACVAWAFLAGLAHAAAPAEVSHGVLIRFEGPITPMLEQYFFRKLDSAKAEGADLVIVEIDSPGGFLEESINIAYRLRDLDWAHTVAYVPRQALSGAAIVALGCDEIIVAPNALLGDAGAIYQDEESLFRYAPEKIRSHLAQVVRGLAAAKGRPPALAEAMVDMNLDVYHVRNRQTRKETYKSQREIDTDPHPDQWEKLGVVFESGKKKFFEVDGTRAVALGLAQGNAASREALVERYRLKNELVVLGATGVDTAVYILNLPLVTGLLFVIGLVAIYVEFMSPGIGVGGVVAVLCFAIFFWSRFLGGTADWLEVVLFASGILFLGLEIFVIPGFGVAGITGILLILVSLIMATQSFLIPQTSRQLTELTHTLLIVGGSGAAFVVVAMILSKHYGSLPVFNQLMLRPPDPVRGFTDEAATGHPAAAAAPLAEATVLNVGDRGIAHSALRPAGRVRFGDRYVEVATDGDFIARGRRVEVVEVSGSRIVVREA